jgi:hypothetical protein
LERQWLRKNFILLWNYNDLINDLKNNLSFFYITNNICESFNKLLNSHLNEGKTSIDSFIKSITSVIKLHSLKKDKIIRRDSRSRFFINIAENIGFNEILTYEIFQNFEFKFNSSIDININIIM